MNTRVKVYFVGELRNGIYSVYYHNGCSIGSYTSYIDAIKKGGLILLDKIEAEYLLYQCNFSKRKDKGGVDIKNEFILGEIDIDLIEDKDILFNLKNYYTSGNGLLGSLYKFREYSKIITSISSKQRECAMYDEWRLKVHKKHKFKCVKCGSNDNLKAHHIKPWAMFENDRFDVSNGITLCEDCHKELHCQYGYKQIVDVENGNFTLK